MSIVQLNIRTRIELETRVLAAALKQSFERGDSDGVSLAHRQLFLLLKDQKPGNGSSSATGETSTTQERDDASMRDLTESGSTEQPVYVPAAYADPDLPEIPQYEEAVDEGSEQNQDREADDQRQEQPDYHQGDFVKDQPEELEVDHQLHDAHDAEQGEMELATPDYQEAAENEPAISAQYESATDETGYHEDAYENPDYQPDESQAFEEQASGVQQFQEAAYQEPSEVQNYAYQEAGESQEPAYQEAGDFQEPAYQEAFESQDPAYQKAFQSRDPADQEAFQSRDPAYQEAGESQDPADQETVPAYEQESSEFYDQAGAGSQEISEGFEAVRNFAREQQDASEQPDVHSAELAEHDGVTEAISDREAVEPASLGSQTPEQAKAIAQYLKYKQTRELLTSEMDEQKSTDTGDPSGELTTQPQEQSQPLSEEEEYIRMRKAPAAKKVELPFDQPSAEYAEIFGSSVIGEQTSEKPPLSEFALQPPSPFQNLSSAGQTGPFDAIPAPPNYEQFIAPPPKTAVPELDSQTEDHQPTFTDTGDFAPALAARNEEMEFDSVSTSESDFVNQTGTDQESAHAAFTDLPPELRQAPTSPFLKITPVTQNLAEDSPPTQQITTQNLPQQMAQNSTQDLPLVTTDRVLEDIRNQQAADYAQRKESQSALRNMPAIDFTLQSESKVAKPDASKPDIDFSLQSESSKPDIDFSLQSESSKPDIDFSLQSESSKPDIDFSLQSEVVQPKTSQQSKSRRPDIDFSLESEKQQGMLSAPTGGGFIEAEFVSSESAEPSVVPTISAGSEVNPFSVIEYQSVDTSASEHGDPSAVERTPPSSSVSPAARAAESAAVAPSSAPDDMDATPFTPDAAAKTPAGAAPPVVALIPGPQLGVPLLAGPRSAAPQESPASTPSASEKLEETTSQEEPLVPAAPKPPDLYAMLGVSQMSPFEEIHKNFLRKIRKILLNLRTAVRPERDELLKELRRNWVARDILCDPVTRTDYDFRDMGLRGSPDAPTPHMEEPQRIGQRTPLRIGELLQCAGLLEQAELEIACEFGTFLVRQGFIQERDLDSVLLGQTLLRDGKITVAQFQVAMELSQSRGANISDTLIEYGYITAAELSQLSGETAAAHETQIPETPVIKEVPVKPRQVEPPAQNLNTSSAVPTWKDQLDWSKPLPVDDDASLIDRSPDKQSLADLLGNVNTDTVPEPDVVKISNNAAPSWKDQLDWNKPEDAENTNDTTSGAASASNEGTPQANEESKPSLSVANAVPSWRDQLDWEQPKQDAQGAVEDSESQYEGSDVDYDEPMTHGSKETQPISIHPPTSIAPNIVLGKGNPRAASGAENFAEVPDSYARSADQPPEPSNAHADQHSNTHEDGGDDHDDDDDHPDEGGGNEGFFKKSLNKLKKGDPKDKKKKRK
jgi:hypothetical protein